MSSRRAPLVSAGCVLGVGMGGFVDGIVFHQILQLHGMLSQRFPRVTLVNVEVNMFWDGLFHAFTWAMTALGLAMLWRATGDRQVPHSSRVLLGSMLIGWGLFHLVEGTVDHLLLGIHHVTDFGNHQLFWDLVYLASGAVMVIAGWLLVREPRPLVMPHAPPHAT